MEGGVFHLANNLKLCKRREECEMCSAVSEQIEQGGMSDLMTPPRPRKQKPGQPPPPPPPPFVCSLPLVKPMCDNTTKFSKFIAKRKPHLEDKILQCAAHLTGISWQKKSHYKYFHNPDANYKPLYKMLVPATKCPSVPLGEVVQRKLVQWLKDRIESRAAEWFKKYWTGDRGHYMLAHSEIGGTNNNNGT